MPLDASPSQPLIDPFGRAITYVRVSVTDRCDFRCVYCMAEDMTFLPKRDVLSLEELDRLCSAFVAKGVRKLRLTGGEPLVRKNIMALVGSLSRHLASGALDELTLTTNGSQLARFAAELADCGVKRINVSVDTLDPMKFKAITRWGELDKVLAGIAAARAAGLHVKVNAVALQGVNEDEFDDLIRWTHGEGMDLTLIETMPLGEIAGDRTEQYLPLSTVRARLPAEKRRRFRLVEANPIGTFAFFRRYPTVIALIAVLVLANLGERLLEANWVLYSGFRYQWGPGDVGLSLGFFGVLYGFVQGVVVRLVVPRLGELRTLALGLAVGAVCLFLFAAASRGWMLYLILVPYVLAWGNAGPAVQSLLTKAVGADEQGLLQGAIASVGTATCIVAPPIGAGLFAWFIGPAAPFKFPGVAFVLGGLLFLAALAVSQSARFQAATAASYQ